MNVGLAVIIHCQTRVPHENQLDVLMKARIRHESCKAKLLSWGIQTRYRKQPIREMTGNRSNSYSQSVEFFQLGNKSFIFQLYEMHKIDPHSLVILSSFENEYVKASTFGSVWFLWIWRKNLTTWTSMIGWNPTFWTRVSSQVVMVRLLGTMFSLLLLGGTGERERWNSLSLT